MYKQLNREQRYAICAYLRAGYKPAQIARELGVSASTITREIKRNSTVSRKVYNPSFAQELASERKDRVRRNRRIPEYLKRRALTLLREKQWSPMQISGFFKLQGKRVSHETIYKWIRADKESKGNLYKHCRHKLKHRSRPVRASNIPGRVSIHDKPKEANGERIGDLEMDLIVGAQGKGAILTVTDRMTNVIWASKLPNRSSQEVNKAIWRLLLGYKKNLKTIVTDNGREFSGHEEITEKLGVPVFFADPYAAWQKGAIEHANKLLRQYIPKKTDFRNITQEQIDGYCTLINERPREKLGFKSPAKVFFAAIK